jgi:hypothetical protein
MISIFGSYFLLTDCRQEPWGWPVGVEGLQWSSPSAPEFPKSLQRGPVLSGSPVHLSSVCCPQGAGCTLPIMIVKVSLTLPVYVGTGALSLVENRALEEFHRSFILSSIELIGQLLKILKQRFQRP